MLDVLRKALVVARKLSLTDAQTWIEKELGGYKSGDTVPPHRILIGRIRTWNPYNGCWMPMTFENANEATILARCHVGQSIGEMEALVKDREGILEFPFPAEIQSYLVKSSDFPIPPTRHLSQAAIVGLIGATRDLVLGWCLDLERDGILGEGLTFNAREKEMASNANYTINYHGPVANSQVQQNTQSSMQTMSVLQSDVKAVAEFLDSVKGHLPDLKLNKESTAQLEADIRAAESQLKAPRPSAIVLRECLRSVRNILEGCVGSVLAAALLGRFPGIVG